MDSKMCLQVTEHPIVCSNILKRITSHPLFSEDNIKNLELNLCLSTWRKKASSYLYHLAVCIGTISTSRYCELFRSSKNNPTYVHVLNRKFSKSNQETRDGNHPVGNQSVYCTSVEEKFKLTKKIDTRSLSDYVKFCTSLT